MSIWQAYPGLKVLLPLLFGIILSAGLAGSLPVYAGLFAAAMIACMVLVLLERKRHAGSFVTWWGLVFAVLWFLLGLLTGSWRAAQRNRTFPPERCLYEAVLLTQPQATAKTVRAEARILCRMRGDSLWHTDGNIQLSVWKDSLSERLSAGDALLFCSAVEPLVPSGNPYEFDYAAYLKRKGVQGEVMLFRQDWQVIPRESREYDRLYGRLSGWQRTKLFFLACRQKLVARMRRDGLQGEAFSVYAALTLGEKAFLSEETEELYSRTGTSHILALSGMHLGILMFFFYYVFAHGLKYTRWRWLLCLVAVSLIWAYTLLAGLPVSLVRASVMYSFSLCGMMMYRRRFTLNVLFWTAVAMLLVAPDTWRDVGFQLSFSAMLGILLLQRRIENLLPVRQLVLKSLWSGISVSLAAQVATLPLVVYYFHYVATTSVWATLVLSFLSLVLLYALPLYLLFFKVSWVAGLLMQLVSLVIGWQHAVLRWIGSWPMASLGPWYLSGMELAAVYLLIVSVAFFLWNRRWKLLWTSTTLMALAVFAVGRSAAQMRLESGFPLLVFYNNYRAPAVQVIYSPERNYLLQTRDTVAWADFSYIKSSFWDRFTTRRPVVLGGKDYADGWVSSAPGLLVTRKFRIGFLHGGVPETLRWPGVRHLDYLYLCRGYRGDVERLMAATTPELVVLDASLTGYEYEKYLRLCRQKKWKFYDMRRCGALKVAF